MNERSLQHMPLFEYRALDASGRMLVGTMEGGSRAEIFEQLDRSGCTPISTKETAGKAAPSRTWREWLTPEPRPEDITAFTVDLAMLLKGRVVLDEALQIVTQMETRRWLVRLLRELHGELSAGKSFSQALAAHPRLFPPIYVKTVEVAEMSGRLEEALSGLAEERQRAERLRKRFVSAISYPLFLVVAAVGVLLFVLLYLIPQFESALQGFRDKIDPSALVVFQISAFLIAHIDTLLIGFVIMLGAGLLVKRLGRGGDLWLRVLSRLPLTKTILHYELTLTFARTLAILVRNGVDISTSLRLIRGVVRQPGAAEEIDGVIADVRQGQRLSQTLAKRKLLPGHVVQMIRVGEESGDLADSAGRVAVFYEAKLDAALGRLIAVVGPATMVLVSLIIAWLIMSVMTALISINDLLV